MATKRDAKGVFYRESFEKRRSQDGPGAFTAGVTVTSSDNRGYYVLACFECRDIYASSVISLSVLSRVPRNISAAINLTINGASSAETSEIYVSVATLLDRRSPEEILIVKENGEKERGRNVGRFSGSSIL